MTWAALLVGTAAALQVGHRPPPHLVATVRRHAPSSPAAATVGASPHWRRSREPRCAQTMPRTPAISIEYCTRCNWMLRSAWMSQELLTTFNGTIGSVALIPNHEGGGKFIVRLAMSPKVQFLIWDRAVEGRFPESKELKQRVRDNVAPDMALGHADVRADQDAAKDEEPVDAAPPSTRKTAFRRLVSIFRREGARFSGIDD